MIVSCPPLSCPDLLVFYCILLCHSFVINYIIALPCIMHVLFHMQWVSSFFDQRLLQSLFRPADGRRTGQHRGQKKIPLTHCVSLQWQLIEWLILKQDSITISLWPPRMVIHQQMHQWWVHCMRSPLLSNPLHQFSINQWHPTITTMGVVFPSIILPSHPFSSRRKHHQYRSSNSALQRTRWTAQWSNDGKEPRSNRFSTHPQ